MISEKEENVLCQAMSHTVFIDLALRFKFCPEQRKIIVSENSLLKTPKFMKNA